MAALPPEQGHNGGGGQDVPSVEVLADQLRPVARAGVDHIPTEPPAQELAALVGVPAFVQRAGGESPDTEAGRVLALRDVLRSTLTGLGDDPYAKAARCLFGATPTTRGRPLAERRRAAAYELDLSPSTFRRRYEPRVLGFVAAELLRIAASDPTPTDEPNPVPSDGSEGGTVYAGPPTAATEPDTATDEAAEGHEGFAGLGWGTPVPSSWRHRAATAEPRRGADLALGFVLAFGAAFQRWGFDRALLVVALPALVASGVWLLLMISTGRDLINRLPKFAVVFILGVVVVGRITDSNTSSSGDEKQKFCDPLIHVSAFPDEHGNCVTDPVFDTSEEEPVEDVSPNYVEPTYTTAHEPVEPTCPPDTGATERRTNFTGPPPLCISPDDELVATVRTNFGDFWIELDPDTAPKGVNSFVFLARWGYYDGVVLAPNERLAAIEGARACRADWGDDACPDHIEDYVAIYRWQAQPPFDPDTDDQGPGYPIEVEPASAPYDDTRIGGPVYAVLPYRTTTVTPDGDETRYINPSDFRISITAQERERLNDDPGYATPLGTVDDTDRVLTHNTLNGDIGRVTSAPMVIDTIIVETPDEREKREEREELQDELADVEQKISDLEKEFEEQLNPPYGQEPADRDDLDWDRHDQLTDQKRELEDAINDTR